MWACQGRMIIISYQWDGRSGPADDWFAQRMACKDRERGVGQTIGDYFVRSLEQELKKSPSLRLLTMPMMIVFL